MSQSVARLKELLFDAEAQELAALAQRLNATAAADADGRDELAKRIEALSQMQNVSSAELRAAIDDLLARAVVSEKLTDNVAAVLSEALRKAEVVHHVALSNSIAPLVVTTIKTELRNSQDEMVEALYPLTGRMVKAYVASAMKDLADQLNRRIEQTPVMLRLRSIATGRSIAELAMAGGRHFTIEDVFLIRRGTGELIARWPAERTNGREHAMSGVLAAINEFAHEALSADEQLRRIEFGDTAVYLRGSPKFLLAARCSGPAPPAIEQLIDDAFISAIERQLALAKDVRDGDDGAKQAALAVVGHELSERLATEKATLDKRGGGRALKVVTFLTLAPLLGWLAYSWYGDFSAERTREAAAQTIAGNPNMTGYLVDLDVTPFGRRVTVAGLAPSETVRFQVAHQLRRRLPRSAIIDRLAIAPGAGLAQPPDLTPEMAALRDDLEAVDQRRDLAFAVDGLSRATANIKSATGDLSRASAAARTPERRAAIDNLAKEAVTLQDDVSQLYATVTRGAQNTTPTDLENLAAKVARFNARFAGAALLQVTGENETVDTRMVLDSTLRGAVNAVLAQSDRTGALAAAALLAIGVEQPALPPAAPPERTPREKLAAAVDSKAVFFSSGVDYKDPAAAAAAIAFLTPLIKDAAALVRIVGYTDEAGGATINSPLAQQRAEKVRSDLIASGAPASLLAVVGRGDRFDISAGTGEGNPNRRVEFELGFDGETAP
jgi:outer membrane protein OmpA-like peptidoglycan-associated protein